jgi:hypothetical protein
MQTAALELEALRQQLHAARTERDQLQHDYAQHERQRQIERELAAAAVPEFVLTPAFREQLAQTSDADGRRRLIAERLDLARRCRPRQPASTPRDTSATSSDEAFLRAVGHSRRKVNRE